MNNILCLLILCLTAAELNCQVLQTDSLYNKLIGTINTSYHCPDTVAKSNFMSDGLLKDNSLITSEDIFQFRLNSLYSSRINNYYSETSLSPLSLTSSIEYNFSDNKKELMTFLNNMYLQSRPTKLQEILGVVDFSGAFLLAGYHIWKTYIKNK